jgi:hypothetical protein
VGFLFALGFPLYSRDSKQADRRSGVFQAGHTGEQQGTSTAFLIAPDRRAGLGVLVNMDNVDAGKLANELLFVGIDNPLSAGESHSPAHLSAGLNRFCAGFGATRFRTSVPNQVPLPVETGNEHRSAVVIASRLVGRDAGRLAPFRGYIPQSFTKTAPAEFGSATEELNGVVCAVRCARRFHRAKVFVAQRENVRPHRSSLASFFRIREQLFAPVASAA